MERLAFSVAQSVHSALGLIHDVAFRRRHPGSFRVCWQPPWLTRWERRLRSAGRD